MYKKLLLRNGTLNELHLIIIFIYLWFNLDPPSFFPYINLAFKKNFGGVNSKGTDPNLRSNPENSVFLYPKTFPESL
ncbi:Uncharacterized protein dnm_007370 [Desulfonema magnum]|uniref:Uncharacterized protein n=1 Tax=Desulfonema magnum TaxID=45655 RepID=A0A975BG12_9BACT|nr:Uncharacterized protein dnm_007370 [Desulfonema magnum]